MFHNKPKLTLKDLVLSDRGKKQFQSLHKEMILALYELIRLHQLVWRDDPKSNSNGNDALYGLYLDIVRLYEKKEKEDKKKTEKEKPYTWASLLKF